MTNDTAAKNTDRSLADDIRVCIHESSHATVGRQYSELGGMTCVAANGFAGLCWGLTFDSRLETSKESTPPLCEQLAPLMPKAGEPKAVVADIYLHCFNRVVELVAGTEGERLFCEGDPWFASDDERQAFAFASLVTSSEIAARAFIEFCRVESRELLTASAHIVRALAAELRISRTMDGAAIDAAISRSVAMQSAKTEQARRKDWRQRERNAVTFQRLVVQ